VRILTVGNLYPPHHLGGYELTWRSAVEHLRAQGHEVGVLTTDYLNSSPEPDIPEDPSVRRELRWYWHDHDFPPISWRGRVALERHNGRILDRELRALRPQVVNWWAMGGMSLSLIERVRRRGLAAVGVVGDDWMLYGPKVDAWTRMARRLGRAGPLAGSLAGVPARLDLSEIVWLFNSEATRRGSLESRFTIDRSEVAHPGIDTALFRAAPEHRWGWRLLYVGRIDERKGIDKAVEALAHLPAASRLTVLGSGDESFTAELRGLASRLGVQDRVDFGLRPREALAGAYARADALLFPVRWEEPWGLVPLEAMAVGLPVVASGTGGSGEYLRDADNALVTGRDVTPAMLAEAVRRLAADQVLRRRLREGGMRTAATFSERGYNERIASALVAAGRDGG